MLLDCHTHTANSPDGQNTVAEHCERAIELGLKAMAITDHCEVNRYYEAEHYEIRPDEKYHDYNFKVCYENSLVETARAKEIYKGKLNLICGIELGQSAYDAELSEKLISDDRIDFVIGSLHELPGRDDFAFIDYTKEDVNKLMEQNFTEILNMCHLGKFDVLGHLTYALRYASNYGVKIDLKPFDEIITDIFRAVIFNGKGIEINTSGLRQKYGKTFPTYEYIKLYRDLGGEIITIGSDAHTTEDLGKGISDGIALAKKAGFNRIAYFIKRKPHFINI